MTRLAERLGYLWQRFVASRDPRPFKRAPYVLLRRQLFGDDRAES
jgi:hypothetical protein